MKNTVRIMTFATLGLLASTSRSQAAYRLLQPGETVTHQFSALPHHGPFGDTVPTPPQGQFWFSPFVATDPDAALRVELFENSTADTPIFVGTWNPLSGLDIPALPDAWQDRQGMVRFTGVRRTTGYESFTVRALTPVDQFRYDVFTQTFAAAPRPGVPQVLVDFNQYASATTNDLVNQFTIYFGISQLPGGGITGGAAAGSLAEITTFGYAAFHPYGLRNLPGDACEVSAFFKIVPSSSRPSSSAECTILFGRSTNTADVFLPDPIQTRVFGPGDGFALPAPFGGATVVATNWYRIAMRVINEGVSDRFAVTTSLQDHGLDGLAPVGPIFTYAGQAASATLARSPVLHPAFIVQGVRFGRATVDNFGFSGIPYAPPVLSAARSGTMLRLNWTFVGTNFVLESTSSLGLPVDWTTANAAVTNNGEQHSVAMPFTPSGRYFRLRYQ